MKMKIADMIGNDLRKRLKVGQQQLHPITLQSIATFYNVSITPVKEVVNRLLDEGILIKNSNGRLTYSRPADNTDDSDDTETSFDLSQELDPPNIVSPLESVSSKIRDWVVLSTLSGHSHDINEQSLAIRYGINRSRLRQILTQISQESWIVHVPNRGWQVRPLSKKDIRDYLEVREIMEIKAFERCEGHFDLQHINQLLENNNNPSGTENPKLDDSLHQYFIKLANNTYVTNFFNVNGQYYSSLFNLATLEAHTVREMASQHCEILLPILEKNWKIAKENLRKHIRSQEQNLYMAIEKIKQQIK